MIVGSAATWIKQGRYRKLARQRAQEVQSLRDAAIRAAPQDAVGAAQAGGLTLPVRFRSPAR